jgi:hypothetical protein
MHIVQMEKNIKKLMKSISRDTFIYEFLCSYGLPKALITIDYRMFLNEVCIDFKRYFKILRNTENATERNNFDQMFSNHVNI